MKLKGFILIMNFVLLLGCTNSSENKSRVFNKEDSIRYHAVDKYYFTVIYPKGSFVELGTSVLYLDIDFSDTYMFVFEGKPTIFINTEIENLVEIFSYKYGQPQSKPRRFEDGHQRGIEYFWESDSKSIELIELVENNNSRLKLEILDKKLLKEVQLRDSLETLENQRDREKMIINESKKI